MTLPLPLPSLARRFGLRLVVQFGSTVTGRANEDSDFDVAVWTSRARKARTLEWSCRLAARLEAALAPRRELDLVLLNGADPLLLFMVARDGVPLWQATPTTWAEFSSYAARRFDDTAKFRASRRRWLEAQLA
ncbi:MAG: nucleotidyltransferase domain-containing protein [Deltaproteobacteria bacterium]|nr:nucleotidyltransferase domain-containing protein [Deltaproteobacteria bacterium]